MDWDIKLNCPPHGFFAKMGAFGKYDLPAPEAPSPAPLPRPVLTPSARRAAFRCIIGGRA